MENKNISANILHEIYRIANGLTMSKTVASIYVGGRGRLNRLIEQGEIRMVKPANKQNGKWFCNAKDVFKCVQPKYNLQ